MADNTSETIPNQPTTGEIEDSNTLEDCDCPEKDLPKPNWITPELGSKGVFTFAEPFNEIISETQELEVKALRSIKEVFDSEEDPYTNIYQSYNLTEQEFKRDLQWKVPIIVFSDSSNQYFYVPATKLLSLPKITGIKYQEVMLAVNLGYLPLGYDVSLLADTLKTDLLATTGITSTVQKIQTSAVQMVSIDEHEKFKKLLKSKKTNKNSYRYKYETLLQKYNDLLAQRKVLHECIEKHLKIQAGITDGKLTELPDGTIKVTASY